MLETTPQERMALLVLAVLLMAGAAGRHAVHRADMQTRLQYTSESSDTLNHGSGSSLHEAVEQEVRRERVRQTPLSEGETLDPNRATADELVRLPRIGPALAERIVAHRTTVGRFRTVADLQAVNGIGPALQAAIEPHLDLGRPPPPSSSRAPPSSSAGGRGSARAVDFNLATAHELQSLPGIGPAIAARIAQYRDENGRFTSFDDLERVSGIGPALRERLQEVGRIAP
ncbi:MAG: hypothetical protein GEU90_15175 [Gemmatimonas sp.]|nr:hypothetical protein [Gemmatimonas sp.]